ncbi:hypothetical protein BT96DRAFT_964924 [Gymnopus androsaceus JB14]|uniref:DUF1279 domain-containing protein n=1 Tax=Gymnopus androsaceus JB14 TaxID=1447944 RepID=A0A6A4HWH1_9AGAR|nr:hypothetical protein BT96DRAFT_964924 [Gymnopus androsaceus JB14]
MFRFLRFVPIRLGPRISAPLLPVTRFRQPASSLTHTPRSSHSRLFSNFPSRLDSSPSGSSSNNTVDENASLSQRLKHLIKTYGWYALGVYLIVGVFDFGVAFAGINLIGADQVSQVVASVKESVAGMINSKPSEPGNAVGNEGLYAMIVLAYTVHKTLFLPVRVGLTAAFTPRLVNWLRSRGWAGGAGTRRAAEEMREKFRNRNK